MRRKSVVTGLAAAGLLLANASAASAVDLYVDNSGNDNAGANNCETPAAPCLTIQHALNRPGTSDVVHIGGGTYSQALAVGNNDSLVEDSGFIAAAAGQAIIDNSVPTFQDAITTSSTGSITGLTVRSDGNAIEIIGNTSVVGNTFDGGTVPSSQFTAEVVVLPPASAATISGNMFDDPVPNDSQAGLAINSPGSHSVQNNSFDGYQLAIQALTGGAMTTSISGNTITGTHDFSGVGAGILLGNGVDATLTANRIHSPGTGTPDGILVTSTAGNAAAELHRNTIVGHTPGLTTEGNPAPVTLDSDLIAKADGANLVLNQNNSVGAGAEVINATIVDAGGGSADVSVGTGTSLVMDSTIVGAGASPRGVDKIGAGTCTISFSRGSGDSTAGCDTGFVSTADPVFVNPAADDYHLAVGSPMVDAGNPAAPATGALDIDGGPRAVLNLRSCGPGQLPRRDIGADEANFTGGPSCVGEPLPKKCKKGKKRKKGKCVKKKRKKKKKKK